MTKDLFGRLLTGGGYGFDSHHECLGDQTSILQVISATADCVSAPSTSRRMAWRLRRVDRALELRCALLVLPVPDFTLGRYWCAYGTQDPTESKTLSITCEINPPRSGVNRRCGGLFVRDSRGRIYLAHSGKVGGGGTGVGKTAFTAWYGHGNWQDVEWPDGNTTRMIIIGRVDGLVRTPPAGSG